MKTYFRAITITLLCCQLTNAYAAFDTDWDSRVTEFPSPVNGMAKAILEANLCNDENSEYKAEVSVEKDILVDDKTGYWLDFDIQHKYIDKSNFEYYVIPEIKLIPIKSGKSEKSEKTLRSVKSKPFDVNCNLNKSPLVIYLPYGYSINYRIWTSPRKNKIISPGAMLRSPSESAPPR